MKNIVFKLFMFCLIAVMSIACEPKVDFGTFLSNNYPAVPVTFSNATTFGNDPFVTTSNTTGGNIQFVMEIPATSGRKIASIEAVHGGNTGINASSLGSPNYKSTPEAVNATTWTFNTTLTEFKTKVPSVSTAAPAAGTQFREIAFIFKIKLDDNTEIITTRVRVRITG